MCTFLSFDLPKNNSRFSILLLSTGPTQNTSHIGRQPSSGSWSLQSLSASCSSGWSNPLPQGSHWKYGTMRRIHRYGCAINSATTEDIRSSKEPIGVSEHRLRIKYGHNIQIPHLFSTSSISSSQSNKSLQSRKLHTNCRGLLVIARWIAGHKLRTIYTLRAFVCIPGAYTYVQVK